MSVKPANDTKESVLAHWKFPCLSLGSIQVHVPLALEASVLNTFNELHEMHSFCFLWKIIK